MNEWQRRAGCWLLFICLSAEGVRRCGGCRWKPSLLSLWGGAFCSCRGFGWQELMGETKMEWELWKVDIVEVGVFLRWRRRWALDWCYQRISGAAVANSGGGSAIAFGPSCMHVFVAESKKNQGRDWQVALLQASRFQVVLRGRDAEECVGAEATTVHFSSLLPPKTTGHSGKRALARRFKSRHFKQVAPPS